MYAQLVIKTNEITRPNVIYINCKSYILYMEDWKCDCDCYGLYCSHK